MNKRGYNNQHLKFLLIGVIMVVLLDRFVFDGTRPYIEDARDQTVTIQTVPPEVPESVRYEEIHDMPEPEERELALARLEPRINIPEDGLMQGPQGADSIEEEAEEIEVIFEAPAGSAWEKYAVPVDLQEDKAKVIIVIDDLGVSRANSKEILELPAPLTLAFLPYASRVGEMVEEGRENGHEIMVHMPMEPENGDLDMGSIYLSTQQTSSEFEEMLQKGLGAFDGYVGINNHMGSRLTQDKDAMQRVMGELFSRGLLFMDSRTIPTSVAAETAAEYHVPHTSRDVFLDHDESLEGVRAALLKTEEMALEKGMAIAIGHPKPNTIQGLKEWLPTLEEKGIQLIPVSAAIRLQLSEGPDASADGPDQSQARLHQ